MLRFLSFFTIIWAIVPLFMGSSAFSATISDRLAEARDLANRSKFEEALEIYDTLVKLDPENVDALNGKARVLSWMGKYDEAVIVYQKALSLTPHNLDSLTGLADVYAWQGNYDRAIHLLMGALDEFPDERQLLIRIARYHLWAQKKRQARDYAARVLNKYPGDKDATEIIRQAGKIFDSEQYNGYTYLNINGDIPNGHNFYTGLRYEPNERYRLFGQIDYLERFNEVDGRISGGVSVRLKERWRLSGNFGFAPDAKVYAIVAGSADIAYSLISPLVLYGGVNASKFKETELYGVSVAGEYYPFGNISILSRVTLSVTDFHENRHGWDTALFLKVTRFVSDTDNFFVYFAWGDESYLNSTIDQIGDIEARTFGLGGTVFFKPSVGILPSFEYQDRDGGTRYLQLGLELKFRW